MLSFPQNLTVESKVELELSHPRCVRNRKAKAACSLRNICVDAIQKIDAPLVGRCFLRGFSY